MLRWKRSWPLLGMLAWLAGGSASAVELRFRAVDLADTQPGHDLWRYTYWLDEFPFEAGYGFTVSFDPDLYTALEIAPPAPNVDWDVLTFPPDPGLAELGLYDAEARFDAPALGRGFNVRFEWLGSGAPGSQPFEVREGEPSYLSVETGTTVVPESRTGVRGAAALLGLVALARGRALGGSRC